MLSAYCELTLLPVLFRLDVFLCRKFWEKYQRVSKFSRRTKIQPCLRNRPYSINKERGRFHSGFWRECFSRSFFHSSLFFRLSFLCFLALYILILCCPPLFLVPLLRLPITPIVSLSLSHPPFQTFSVFFRTKNFFSSRIPVRMS